MGNIFKNILCDRTDHEMNILHDTCFVRVHTFAFSQRVSVLLFSWFSHLFVEQKISSFHKVACNTEFWFFKSF